MIIDTDVFIWYLRGRDSAAKTLSNVSNVKMSAVSYMELVQGMRNKTELNLFRQEMMQYDWKILTLTPEVTSRAMTYVEEFALSHSMMLADALIAATSVQNGETLLTGNVKHYQFLSELELEKFKA